MEKKESPKSENAAKPKISGLSSRAFSIIKLALGVCLLPLVYSVSVSFFNEFSRLESPLRNYFWLGIISLLIIYLFVWEPAIIYAKGQKLLELFFSFFKPLVRVAPYLLPIYTIVLFILYGAFSFFFKSEGVIKFFLFLFGFSIGLHLVFSAKSIRSKQGDFLKANYIFGFSFIYILNLALLSLFLNFIFGNFSFVSFSNNSFQAAGNILYAVFKQLF
ncbi:MAG: hypothetical protein WC321_00600 [Candidatus Omnitrophota bacterium]|jgi:hypothetical protein